MAEKPEGFVTRRGKRVSAESLNMTDLKIDDVPGEKFDTYETPRRVSRFSFASVVRSWVFWVILALLVISPVVLGEVLRWQYTQGVQSAKNQLASYVDSDVLSVQTKVDLSADQIGGMADRVNDMAAHMCKGGFLDNAALLYPRAKSAHAECIAAQEKFSTLSDTLNDYELQRRYLEDLGTIIAPLTQPLSDQFAVLSAQLASWQKVSAAIANLNPPTRFNETHAVVATQADAITKLWSQLYTAYNAQEGSKFTAAQAKLATHYKKLQSTQAAFANIVDATQSEVSQAYSSIGL